jgi:hypothetical protein
VQGDFIGAATTTGASLFLGASSFTWGGGRQGKGAQLLGEGARG